jgi:tyrosyl-tRNA synthetase
MSKLVPAFLTDEKNRLVLPHTEDVYQSMIEKMRMELEDKSTPFVSRNYQGHMNYDISRPHYDALVAALPFNQNQVALESSAQTTAYELAFIQDMKDMVGYGHEAWGYVSSGGTGSNIEALWIAREKARAEGSQSKIVLASETAHYSVEKACKILDLVLHRCKTHPTTGSIILPASLAGVLAVVVNIGATETGIVDDVAAVVQVCNTEGVYVHADAAYGGYYLSLLNDPNTHLSQATFESLKAVRQCDSICIDPHKLGYAPYGAGVILLKNGDNRRFVNCTKNVGYIDSHISSASTLEGSRSGAMCTSVYFGHKMLASLYPQIMRRLLDGAEKLKTLLGIGSMFEVYNPTDLGVVFFRVSPKWTKIPMEYYVTRFCNSSNKSIQLVVNHTDRGPHFRIVVMDPNFVDYCGDFVQKLGIEVLNCTAEFDSFIEKRVVNLKNIAEECDTEEDLRALLTTCKKFVAYNGFEPSGRIHIAQALITVMNTNALIENGGRMIIYIADWFAQLNHKMGGDLAKIQTVGRYFIEVFKACGINLLETQFIWASDFINGNPNYLPRVLDVSTKNSLNRMKRCCQIMGRKEGDELSSSQIIYPCMQCADIFELGVDVCQLGVDQRKVNMLAREYAKDTKVKPPIILSHHMLMGLKGPAVKMSKSDPQGAIFMEDTREEVVDKLLKAFCNDEAEGNPIFDYLKHIVLRWFGTITLNGKSYTSIDEIAKDFGAMDKKNLKLEVAEYINKILDPVRKHFENPAMKELAAKVAGYRVTR